MLSLSKHERLSLFKTNMRLRKLNRNIHRDLGYIFFFLTIIYGASGLALNHIRDFNPSYIITTSSFKIQDKLNHDELKKSEIIDLIKQYAPNEKYKSHYFPESNLLKIFIYNGNMIINLDKNEGLLETTKRRPLLHAANYLHYNPKKLWTVISDIYAISLMILAISGLFIIKGKNGITGRGAVLTTLGIIIPLLFLMSYYWKLF